MTSTNFAFAQHLLGDEDLTRWITSLRLKGRSYDSIARELWKKTEGKVDVTGWSIRRWIEEEKVG